MSKRRDQTSEQGFLNHELESLYHKIAEEKLPDTAGGGDMPQDEIRIGPGRAGTGLKSGAERESGAQSGSRIARFFLFAVPILVISAFALFIWPTPYEYSTLKTADRTYLVKTNRLTQAKIYFHNGRWMRQPLPEMPPLRLPDPLAIQSPGDKPQRMSEESAPAAPGTAKIEPPSPSPQGEARAGRAKSAPPGPAPEQAPARPLPGVETGISAPPVSQAATEPKPGASRPGGKPYAVQIRAFQNEKELRLFLKEKDVKKRRDIHWAKMKINKQVWYRVFLGRFPDQAAARKYMQKNKIDSLYPGSFVQKII